MSLLLFVVHLQTTPSLRCPVDDANPEVECGGQGYCSNMDYWYYKGFMRSPPGDLCTCYCNNGTTFNPYEFNTETGMYDITKLQCSEVCKGSLNEPIVDLVPRRYVCACLCVQEWAHLRRDDVARDCMRVCRCVPLFVCMHVYGRIRVYAYVVVHVC